MLGVPWLFSCGLVVSATSVDVVFVVCRFSDCPPLLHTLVFFVKPLGIFSYCTRGLLRVYRKVELKDTFFLTAKYVWSSFIIFSLYTFSSKF